MAYPRNIYAASRDPSRPFIALINPNGTSYWYDLPERIEIPETMPLHTRNKTGPAAATPFASGTVGLIAYDDYLPDPTGGKLSRFWQVSEPDIIDDWSFFDKTNQSGWRLYDKAEPAHYLDDCKQILDWIAAGRFYQSNLLRYFDADVPESFDAILTRILTHGGPYSAWIRTPELEIISLSPERFVTISRDGEDLVAATFPIKGTAPRAHDPNQDAELARQLASCPKNRAELAMIIDLMRNDFYRISSDGDVTVHSGGQLTSFATVHHLIGDVRTRVSGELPLSRLLRYLCPAGSITGAPKREAMLAIGELERRQRHYFMGNVFFHNPDLGFVDSSVLIRTIQRIGPDGYEFAAGSGVVLTSTPEAELEEIGAKCRCITTP